MKTNLKTMALAAACVLLGVVIGRMLPVGTGSEIPKGVEHDGPKQTGESHTKVSERRISDWPVSSGPQRQDDFGTDGMEAGGDEKMVWVSASLLDALSRSAGTPTLGQNLFSGEGKIEEILKITDQEKAEIQTAWKKSQQKLRDLEATAMESEVSDDGSVVTITVPDLSARTGEIGEGFGSEIRNALGENRSDVFLAVKQVDRMFAPEAGERTYRIEPEETGDGKWRYHMTLEGPGSRRVWVSETIPEEISHLTDVASIRRSLSEE